MKSFYKKGIHIAFYALALPAIILANRAADDDDDEIVGAPHSPNANSETFVKTASGGQPEPYTLEDFHFEILAVTVVLAYIVNYLIGNSKNQAIAKQWTEKTFSTWASQFAHIGAAAPSTESTTDAPSRDTLVKESNSEYLLYASGRAGVDSLYAKLELLNRQDLVSTVMNFLNKDYDRVLLNINLGNKSQAGVEKGNFEKFIWSVALTKLEKNLRNDRWDLKNFTRPISTSKLPPQYSLLTESGDLESLLHPLFISTLDFAYPMIESFILTDQPMYEPYSLEELDAAKNQDLRLQVTLRLPNPEMKSADLEKFNTVVEGVFWWVDYLRTEVNLTAVTKTKCKQRREEVWNKAKKELEKDNEQPATKKKEDFSNLTKEQQRKLEEKEYKKSLKKKKGGLGGKMKMMKA